jgi:hypothetical protein
MKRTVSLSGILAIAAITGIAPFAAAVEDCRPVGGLSFLCGPVAVEDLVQVPGAH